MGRTGQDAKSKFDWQTTILSIISFFLLIRSCVWPCNYSKWCYLRCFTTKVSWQCDDSRNNPEENVHLGLFSFLNLSGFSITVWERVRKVRRCEPRLPCARPGERKKFPTRDSRVSALGRCSPCRRVLPFRFEDWMANGPRGLQLWYVTQLWLLACVGFVNKVSLRIRPLRAIACCKWDLESSLELDRVTSSDCRLVCGGNVCLDKWCPAPPTSTDHRCSCAVITFDSIRSIDCIKNDLSHPQGQWQRRHDRYLKGVGGFFWSRLTLACSSHSRKQNQAPHSIYFLVDFHICKLKINESVWKTTWWRFELKLILVLWLM